MEAFKEWEKTIPCADGCPDCGATGDEAAWRAALKWVDRHLPAFDDISIMINKELEDITAQSLCYCGSGLEYKHCHGDAVKQEECSRVANKRMAELIADTIFSKEKSNGNGQ